MAIEFDLPAPHTLSLAVQSADIDAYNHVNNAVYLTWCDRAAWDHSAKLGLPIERCLQMDKGMAVLKTTLVYLRPALRDDTVTVATWLLPSESRLRVGRHFQIVRPMDGVTLARAQIDYACIELSSGRPARWPQAFRDSYASLPTTQEALSALPKL